MMKGEREREREKEREGGRLKSEERVKEFLFVNHCPNKTASRQGILSLFPTKKKRNMSTQAGCQMVALIGGFRIRGPSL